MQNRKKPGAKALASVDASDDTAWAIQWLDSVAGGQSTMSQRRLSTVQKRGGIAQLRRLAKARGVHLLLIQDDAGVELLAASVKPFKVVC